MPLFAYRATDADGKEVKGSIDAPTEDSARETLVSDQHLILTELWEASRSHVSPAPAPPPLLRTSFVFEGKDASGIVRKGTIQAETKYEAFDKLRHEHHLFLTLLSPMGVKASQHDPDLEQWQVKSEAIPAPITPASDNGKQSILPVTAATPSVPVSQSPAPSPPKKTVGFTVPTDAPPMLNPSITLSSPPQSISSLRKYFPLLSTLRLYAGWLLAWYAFFVAFGYYSTVRALPFDIPLVMSFYASPLIYSVTLAVFLFLLCTEIHKAVNGKMASGLILTIGGSVAFVALKMGG